MRRELLTVLIVVVLVGVLLGPGVGVATAQSYSDVATGDWFYTAVEQLAAAGVVTGFTDGTFRPYEPVTRAQFASMLARAVAPAQVFQEPFDDVYSTDWFYGSVASLYQAGLISGTSPTSFSPAQTIDRQQTATLVMRALAYVQAQAIEAGTAEEPPQPSAPVPAGGADETTEAAAGDETTTSLAADSTAANGQPSPGADDPVAPTTDSNTVPTDPDTTTTSIEPDTLTTEPTTDPAGQSPDPGATGTEPLAPAVDPGAAAAAESGSQIALTAVRTQPPVDLQLTDEQMQAWLAGFRDRGFIDPAHRTGVANAYRYSVVSGSGDGWFYPSFGLSRAQAAGMLYQALYTTLQQRTSPPAAVPAAASYPNLSQGSSGFLVSFIESRLSALKYDVGRLDGVYDEPLRDAVRAFQKVEGLSRDGEVGPQVWDRIGKARIPALRYSTGGNRVEIDLSRQVLLLVNGGRVVKILPVATGAPGWNTPTGHYSISRKLPYWRRSALGLLYKPSYFVGGIAIHGSYSIPPYPASHGCVRVPVWATDALYPQLPVGMPVHVYY